MDIAHEAASSTNESQTIHSPHRTKGVRESIAKTVVRRDGVSNSWVRSTTRSAGSIAAVMPETPAFTTHRSDSTSYAPGPDVLDVASC